MATEMSRTRGATRGLEQWRLVERYVERFPDDWRLLFRRGDEVLEVTVPEDVWRAFGTSGPESKS